VAAAWRKILKSPGAADGRVRHRDALDVITGGEKFFTSQRPFTTRCTALPTKARLIGSTILGTNEENRQRMEFDEDFVVIHDLSRWLW